jgi:hypothetical protein
LQERLRDMDKRLRIQQTKPVACCKISKISHDLCFMQFYWKSYSHLPGLLVRPAPELETP